QSLGRSLHLVPEITKERRTVNNTVLVPARRLTEADDFIALRALGLDAYSLAYDTLVVTKSPLSGFIYGNAATPVVSVARATIAAEPAVEPAATPAAAPA